MIKIGFMHFHLFLIPCFVAYLYAVDLQFFKFIFYLKCFVNI